MSNPLQRLARALARRVLPPHLRLRLRTRYPRLAGRHSQTTPITYDEKLQREGEYWGRQTRQQQARPPLAWLEHPLIRSLHAARCHIDGLDWPDWLKVYYGNGEGERHAVELGSGTGHNGRRLVAVGAITSLTGYDISDGRLQVARAKAADLNLKATYIRQDANSIALEPCTCDLVFCRNSFHHFLQLEHIMDQAATALTEHGLFILEEYVGPSVFQYTDKQLQVVNDLLCLLADRYRHLLDGAGTKRVHHRPSVAEVQNASPFEAIRSADILPLFRQKFDVLHEISLGGTIQRLLYDGILHNFKPGDPFDDEIIRAIDRVETTLIASGALPSDVMLLVGKKMSHVSSS